MLTNASARRKENMALENAIVFVAEDEADWRSTIVGILEDAGHKVVATASTLEDALQTVGKLKELGVQVATVDGNYDPSDATGNGGRAVIRAIRENAPLVKIIGVSTMHKGVDGADKNIKKIDADNLGELVRSL